MPSLNDDDRKRMLGRQPWACGCGIRPYKDYCRQCDEFFYECMPGCERCDKSHNGHRLYPREDLTPDGWLAVNNKKPYSIMESWYWGTEEDKDPADPDSDDMLLPAVIFAKLAGHLTYPNVKRYKNLEAAIEDFRSVYNELFQDNS